MSYEPPPWYRNPDKLEREMVVHLSDAEEHLKTAQHIIAHPADYKVADALAEAATGLLAVLLAIAKGAASDV